ncbi:MAG: SCO family protein [Rhizobiaceae bacterium]|nr:SCO family protein [Rhizobiaceae bacterium]
MTWITAFRSFIWLAIGALAGLLIGFGGFFAGTDGARDLGSTGTARIGGPFQLTSHKGEVFNNAKLAGKPYLVFFGFTFCPDICPTTLFELTDLMAEMGPAADRITPILITVDPERDTQGVLAEYMTAFDPRIVALRGSATETDAAAKAFAAFYAKVPTENGSYTMDHTAGVYLMDSAGQFAGTLDMDEPRDVRLTKLRQLAERSSVSN